MKKIITLVCVVAVIASMGIFASFAAEPEVGESARDDLAAIMWTRWGVDGTLGDWGGADGIGNKGQVCTTADQVLNLEGLIAIPSEEFPVIDRIGYVIEGTTSVCWIDAELRDAEADETVAFANSPYAYDNKSTVYHVALDTSTMPEGTYNIWFVFEYDGEVYKLAENTESYIDQGSPAWPYTTVISSGKNYVEPTEAPATEVPTATPEVTEAPATEAPTDAPETTDAPADETKAPADETKAPADATKAPADATKAPENDRKGCGSIVTAGTAVVILAGAALFHKKKD